MLQNAPPNNKIHLIIKHTATDTDAMPFHDKIKTSRETICLEKFTSRQNYVKYSSQWKICCCFDATKPTTHHTMNVQSGDNDGQSKLTFEQMLVHKKKMVLTPHKQNSISQLN